MRRLDVVAVGHALVDLRVLVDKFPGPDQEAAILGQSRGAGGSAVNVAIDVARLGGSSGVVAKIGFDSFGRVVYEDLWRHGVALEGLRIDPEEETGFSIVVIDGAGRISICGHKGAAEKLEPGELPRELIGRARAVHIASLRVDTSIAAAEAARATGALVSWDPGRRLAAEGLQRLSRLLGLVDLVFVNRLEARLLTGTEDPDEAARAILAHGPRYVVVKAGAEGATLYTVGGEKMHVPAFRPPRVVDTTGAGDAFAAAMLYRLVRGDSIREAMVFAAAAAALKVSRLGAHSMPSEAEVRGFLGEARGLKPPGSAG